MIYTYGCSFTKWRWHTWSDWLGEYTDEPVTNLAWPGNSNQTILYQILSTDISDYDTVYVMLTAPNRTGMWYDPEFIKKNQIHGKLPKSNVGLPIGNMPDFGYYRHTPEYDPSLTEMYISNWHAIYQIQTVLDRTGCNYKMMFWQNPWHDVRPILKPKWELTWFNKRNKLSKEEHKIAKTILNIPGIKKLLNLIDWSRFNIDVDIDNPNSFNGLWDYQLSKIDLLQYQHLGDRHPCPIVAHDYLTEKILNIDPNTSIRNHALDVSRKSLSLDDGNIAFDSLIPLNNDYTTPLLLFEVNKKSEHLSKKKTTFLKYKR